MNLDVVDAEVAKTESRGMGIAGWERRKLHISYWRLFQNRNASYRYLCFEQYRSNIKLSSQMRRQKGGVLDTDPQNFNVSHSTMLISTVFIIYDYLVACFYDLAISYTLNFVVWRAAISDTAIIYTGWHSLFTCLSAAFPSQRSLSNPNSAMSVNDRNTRTLMAILIGLI